MQAKNALSSSKELLSEFGKTVEQVVRHWSLCRDGAGDKGWNRPLDVTKDRMVIIVGPDSPATTRVHLARGLEARRQVGSPVLTKAESSALADFDGCIGQVWSSMTDQPLTDEIVREISSLTFVVAIDPSGPERIALASILGPSLAAPAESTSMLQLLERVSGDLMSARGGVDLLALRLDLLSRGAKLASRPDYRDDIEALKTWSAEVAGTLAAFEVVGTKEGKPIGIVRHCQSAVNAAAGGGPLLLLGEPGAGKSAVINALGRHLKANGLDVVQLAVDRFSI